MPDPTVLPEDPHGGRIFGPWTAGAMTEWWSHILVPGGRKDLGQLLASHPDARVKTERLLTGLTVMKLIKIANCEYNYCRIGRDIAATGDVVGRSDRAWRILDNKVANIQMRSGTAWMRTVDLLSPGSEEGLARVRALPIDRVIDVCERLIQGPYTACADGTGRQSADRLAVRPEVSRRRAESASGVHAPPPADFDEWATWWYRRLGARPEGAAYLAGVAAWRKAWQPKRVRAVLLAESHVAQRDGDLRSRVRTDWTGIRGLPSQYVRLVYCLGYGESGICSPPPQGNGGTWQYWNIFGQIARGENQPPKSASSLSSRLRWKLAVLTELQGRGIWLQDASALGLYLGSGRRVDPTGQVQLIRDSYQRWVWPSVEGDNPEKVWVIGSGVAGALAGLPGVERARVVTQPQDREPGRHLAGLARMREDLSHL